MHADVVLDTNIIVYAASNAEAERNKSQIARRLIAENEFGISGQVLAEFYNTVTKKLKVGLDHHTALDWLEQLEEMPCVPVDASLVFQGAEMSDRHRVSYWDGAVLAAARRIGARIVYTEDLNHGQSFDGVTVINPFLEPAA